MENLRHNETLGKSVLIYLEVTCSFITSHSMFTSENLNSVSRVLFYWSVNSLFAETRSGDGDQPGAVYGGKIDDEPPD
jgi:hypothetical protein